MIVDFLPSIKATCEERIRLLDPRFDSGRVDELERVIALCTGLSAQQHLFTNATTVNPKDKTCTFQD